MNIYITAAVKELKEKLNAYLSLLSYRYANLCVKAELLQSGGCGEGGHPR